MPREHTIFDSSWVGEAWYTEEKRLVEVSFNDGHRHFFFEVEPATWHRFQQAGSPGRFVRDILERHPHRSR